jgi:hypothetical protein
MSRFTRLVTQMMATQAATRTTIDATSPAECDPPDTGLINGE